MMEEVISQNSIETFKKHYPHCRTYPESALQCFNIAYPHHTPQQKNLQFLQNIQNICLPEIMGNEIAKLKAKYHFRQALRNNAELIFQIIEQYNQKINTNTTTDFNFDISSKAKEYEAFK